MSEGKSIVEAPLLLAQDRQTIHGLECVWVSSTKGTLLARQGAFEEMRRLITTTSDASGLLRRMVVCGEFVFFLAHLFWPSSLGEGGYTALEALAVAV